MPAPFDGGPIDELSVETWDKVIAANLRGPFLCTRAAMRIMKPQGGGRILNIGSISAQRPRLKSAPYTTSKFGLWGLTNVTALWRAGNLAFRLVACIRETCPWKTLRSRHRGSMNP